MLYIVDENCKDAPSYTAEYISEKVDEFLENHDDIKNCNICKDCNKYMKVICHRYTI